MTFQRGCPTVTEEMTVWSSGDVIYFVTKTSSHDDNYTAKGRMTLDRQILGKWKSREGTNDMEGVFMLTVSPDANFMYGYFTTPDKKGGLVYGTWTLAKMTGADEAEVEARMADSREMLKESTVTTPPAGGG